MTIFIGCVFLIAAGALLHDVPFLRFFSALMLFSVGNIFLTIGLK